MRKKGVVQIQSVDFDNQSIVIDKTENINIGDYLFFPDENKNESKDS